MTPADQFRASVALGVLSENNTLARLHIFPRTTLLPSEIGALRDVVEILKRIEAATPASEPRNDAHSRENRPVPRVAAPYQEV